MTDLSEIWIIHPRKGDILVDLVTKSITRLKSSDKTQETVTRKLVVDTTSLNTQPGNNKPVTISQPDNQSTTHSQLTNHPARRTNQPVIETTNQSTSVDQPIIQLDEPLIKQPSRQLINQPATQINQPFKVSNNQSSS
jgi:hypothetical protein